MKHFKKYNWFILSVAVLLGACTADEKDFTVVEDPLVPSAGTADFSKFVALGNSLTAGYTDGALFKAGQENSVPNIMAKKFLSVGGGTFTQPLMNDNLGGLLLGGNVIAENRLFFNGSAPQRLPGMPTTEVSNVLSGPFNNMGVPGAKSFHLLAPGYGNLAGVPTGQANPYFARFASSANTTVLGDALAQNPTFFMLWIGNNDVLSYATSGGVGVNQAGNPNPATYGSNDITDPALFAQVYNSMVSNLVANGAKGVVANIPDVTSIPYFTTVPYNPVPMDAATATMVNQGYAPYNAGLAQAEAAGLINAAERAKRSINFAAGNNAVVIEDEYLTNLSALGLPSIRQATERDLIVLPASAFIGTLVNNNPQLINGVTVPLGDQWVLLPEEQNAVAQATTAFNAVIEAAAAQQGLAFVDTFSILNEVANVGGEFDEFVLNSSLVTGGAFSLDGVHPGSRGHAYIANKFLEAIETQYNAVLPRAKAADYNPLFPVSLP